MKTEITFATSHTVGQLYEYVLQNEFNTENSIKRSQYLPVTVAYIWVFLNYCPEYSNTKDWDVNMTSHTSYCNDKFGSYAFIKGLRMTT
jgi:hypothetical protein